MKQLNIKIAFVGILAITSCKTDLKSSSAINVSGALRDIMHKGDLSAKIDLRSLSNLKNLYALGAVENLDGEILILNSKPHYSQVSSDSLITNHDFEAKASLLVSAEISDWQEREVTGVNKVDLENQLKNYSDKSNLESFPFLLKGIIKTLNWHIISWNPNDSIHTPEKHRNSGLHGILLNEPIKIVGFYSENHQGVFTHHSTNIHMHFITQDERMTGHVDNLEIENGTKLFLPKTEVK